MDTKNRTDTQKPGQSAEHYQNPRNKAIALWLQEGWGQTQKVRELTGINLALKVPLTHKELQTTLNSKKLHPCGALSCQQAQRLAYHIFGSFEDGER